MYLKIYLFEAIIVTPRNIKKTPHSRVNVIDSRKNNAPIIIEKTYIREAAGAAIPRSTVDKIRI